MRQSASNIPPRDLHHLINTARTVCAIYLLNNSLFKFCQLGWTGLLRNFIALFGAWRTSKKIANHQSLVMSPAQEKKEFGVKWGGDRIKQASGGESWQFSCLSVSTSWGQDKHIRAQCYTVSPMHGSLNNNGPSSMET